MGASDQTPHQSPPEPETPWQYTSGGQQSSAPPDTASTAPPVRPGETVEWTASEYIAHQRGVGWYVALAGAGILLGALIYLITSDLFSVIVIAIITIIVGVAVGQKPRVIAYRLDQRGLTVGRKFYGYDAFKAFSLVADGPFEAIVFTPLHRFIPPLSIYFAPEDEQKIINVLSTRLPLQPASRDFFDTLMRRARF